MDLPLLVDAVQNAAALRRVRRLQPVGGPGDKVMPPTYPGEKRAGAGSSARHVFEQRKIAGSEVRCVLLDSVQAQANRLEEALERAITRDGLPVPRVAVDFRGSDVADLGELSALTAPHRIFDAILRDSDLDGVPFRDSELGRRLVNASSRDASPLLEHSPTSLLFGAWNSNASGGGMGVKFARVVVSEIVGIDAVDGNRTGSRLDPTGIRREVGVVRDGDRFRVAGAKDSKSLRPSEINHGNIAPTVEPLGVSIDHALHTWVLTLAGLRRLAFGGSAERDTAGRAVLAALGLVAALEQDRAGYALRSRCDLVPDTQPVDDQGGSFEIVHADGTREAFEMDAKRARAILDDAVAAARKQGFLWSTETVRLRPAPFLVELIARSRALAPADETADE